jgi:hypothetical protein
MLPAHVHFNGSVNLAEAESVVREIVARVPSSVRRIPDGETGTGVTGSSSRCRSSCSCPGWFRRRRWRLPQGTDFVREK